MTGTVFERADAAARLAPTQRPFLFLHGCGVFHSQPWLDGLQPGQSAFVCKDHWFMRARPQRTAELILEWIERTA